MERKKRTNNWGAELWMSRPIEDIQHFTTAVEAVVDVTARTGRKYKALEFVDPEGEIRRVSVWNPHVVEGLEIGEPIEIHLEKKGAFWNLGNLVRLNAPKAPVGLPKAPETVSTPSEPLSPPAYDPRAHLDRIEKKLDQLLAFQERPNAP